MPKFNIVIASARQTLRIVMFIASTHPALAEPPAVTVIPDPSQTVISRSEQPVVSPAPPAVPAKANAEPSTGCGRGCIPVGFGWG